MADKRENVVHVKLSDEADQALELLTLTHPENAAKSTIAAAILERALLGEAHAIKVAIARVSRQVSSGSVG